MMLESAISSAATGEARLEFIGTVHVGQLRHFRWPVMRMLCPRYVEKRELTYYLRELLETHRWTRVRCVPHRGERGDASASVFDVYGVPSDTRGARRLVTAAPLSVR